MATMDENDKNQTILLARAAAEQTVDHHARNCAFNAQDGERRIRKLEQTLARLIGFMIGSGILGGTLGSALTRLFP